MYKKGLVICSMCCAFSLRGAEKNEPIELMPVHTFLARSFEAPPIERSQSLGLPVAAPSIQAPPLQRAQSLDPSREASKPIWIARIVKTKDEEAEIYGFNQEEIAWASKRRLRLRSRSQERGLARQLFYNHQKKDIEEV